MSLYHEVYHGESFSEQDFYDAVRYIFQPEVGDASEAVIDNFLIEKVSEMTPEEAEGFWSKVGNFAKKVGSGALKVVSKAAPMVGTAVGAAYGVPHLGGMAGNLVGNFAGAGSKALDRVPDFKERPGRRRRRRRTTSRRKRSNPELRNAWRQTKRHLRGAGKQALRAANRYAAQNPVRPMYRDSYEDSYENTPAALSNVVNDSNFQALLFGRSNGHLPVESISENDIQFLDAVEAINYLTEDIIAQYYENELLEDDQYFVDDFGELVVNHPEEREERIEAYIESCSVS